MSILPPLGVLLLAISTLACSAFRAPLTPPERGGPPWIELRTPHFVVKTDADRRSARRLIDQLEWSHVALSHAIGIRERESEAPLDVVVFERRRDFRELAHRAAGAFFSRHQPADFEPRPVIVMPDSEITYHTHIIIQHELAHRFLRTRYPNMPPWLSEGLAQYYEPTYWQRGRLILGSQVSLDFSDRPFQEGFEQIAIPAWEAPKLGELLDANRDEFYPEGSKGVLSNKQMERQRALYVGAWRLVHMLMNGPDPRYRARFGKFLDDIQRGERPRDAFFERFGDDWSALDKAYRAYLTVERLPLRILDSPSAPNTTATEREMSASEVHVLWARMRSWSDEDRLQVRPDVAAASALDAEALDVLLLRTMLAIRDKDFATAQAALDKADRRAPDEPAVLIAHITLRDVRWRASVGEKAPFQTDQRRRDLVNRLAKRATSARHLDIVADDWLTNGRLDDALQFSTRALAVDPLCWSCHHTRAAILLKQGKVDDAAASSDRAIALSPERASIEELVETRRKIEKARLDARESALLGTATAPTVEPLGAAQGAQTFAHPIDPTEIQRVVRASFGVLRACYQAGLARDRNPRGLVKVRFVIGLDGRVTDVQSVGATLPDAGARDCVVREFRALVFPRLKGGTGAGVWVTYPITFSPDGP